MTQNGTITIHPWKALASVIASVAAVFGIGSVLHSSILVPSILHQAAEEARQMDADVLDRHMQNPHPGAVSRAEQDFVLESLREIKAELVRLNQKLDDR